MAATFAPPPISARRTVTAIAAAALVTILVVFAWAAGRSTGYDSGRDAGRVDAWRDCGEGFDRGFLGNVASIAAPRGHRTIVCAVPETALAD